MTESKRTFPWSEDEIISSYRTALDKKEQIQILADLNVCTTQDIEALLRAKGVDLPVSAPAPRTTKWTVQEEDQLRKLAGEGKTAVEIAGLVGRTHKAVEQKLSKMHISLRQQPVKPEALPTGKDIMISTPAKTDPAKPDHAPIELPLKVVEGRHVNKNTGLTREELLALLFDVLYITDLSANLQTVFARYGVKVLDHLKKGNTYEQ